MAEFAYNNSKNASTGHTLFEFNFGYYLHVSFENKYDTRSRFSFAKKLAMEMRELMNVCHQNFLYTQDF